MCTSPPTLIHLIADRDCLKSSWRILDSRHLVAQSTEIDKRRRIERVISQMSECYQGNRGWARDRWHWASRWLRKVLSHTMGVYLCQQQSVFASPLRFAGLLTD